MNSNLDDIKETLESIRADAYSNVSEKLLSQIVDIQFQHQERETRPQGKSKTQRIIREYIESQDAERSRPHAVD